MKQMDNTIKCVDNNSLFVNKIPIKKNSKIIRGASMNAMIMRERALIKVRLRHLNRLKQASSSYQEDFSIGGTNSVRDYPRNKNKKVQRIINNNNLQRFCLLLPPKKC